MLRGLVLVVLTGCQIVFPLDDPGCPANYVKTGTGTYRYELSTMTMPEAQAICRKEGELARTRPTHLVVLSSDDERMMVHTFVNSEEVWIGLTDTAVENDFHWLTTENEGDPFGRIPQIAPWGNGEPSSSGDEDCVELRADALFNDLGCEDAHKPFVCECDEFDTVDADVPAQR